MNKYKKNSSLAKTNKWIASITIFNRFEKTSTNNNFHTSISSTCFDNKKVIFVNDKSYDYPEPLNDFFNNSERVEHLKKGSINLNHNHYWEFLVPNYGGNTALDTELIKSIVDEVLQKGNCLQCNSKSNTLLIQYPYTNNGTTKNVHVKLFINENGQLYISGGWIKNVEIQ